MNACDEVEHFVNGCQDGLDPLERHGGDHGNLPYDPKLLSEIDPDVFRNRPGSTTAVPQATVSTWLMDVMGFSPLETPGSSSASQGSSVNMICLSMPLSQRRVHKTQAIAEVAMFSSLIQTLTEGE